MLRVKVELVPFGDESRAKELAQMVIANDGTGTETKGNYVAWLRQKTMRSAKFGIIEGYPRASKPVWDLVAKAIQECGKADPKGNSLAGRLKNRLLPGRKKNGSSEKR